MTTTNHKSVVSLFSGVGGFELGFEKAGYTTAFQCEIDAKCRSVLRRHFPNAAQWDNISTLTGQHIIDTLKTQNKTPDLVIWGSPCQDLSIGGAGAGLAGDRSGLFYQGIRIINEIRKATNNEYPAISVWENVAGALSSNDGADFGLIIDEMANSGAMVIEWRVLDAQFFGIPQRRRRVFVIAIFNPVIAERCSDPLLPVTEGVHRDTAASETKKQDPFADTSKSIRNDSVWWNGGQIADTLTTTSHAQYMPDKQRMQVVLQTSSTSTSTPHAVYVEKPSCVIGQISLFDECFAEGNAQFVSNSVINSLCAVDTGVKNQMLSDHKFIALKNDDGYGVRRLTPLECERLMGWHDNWTAFTDDGKEIADTQRYKMCGNGVASPVAEWIALQLKPLLETEIKEPQ